MTMSVSFGKQALIRELTCAIVLTFHNPLVRKLSYVVTVQI